MTDFSDALQEIKDGPFKVTRTGWNGKDMWIAVQKPDENSHMTMPYIYIHTAKGDLLPWLPSQADLLADDWEAVD